MSEKMQISDEEIDFINYESIEEEDVYEVEAIVEKKKIGGKWKYKVKWVGYPEEQSTWEPEENLQNVKKMLKEFEESWESKNQRENKEEKKKIVKSGPKIIKNSSEVLKEPSLNKKTKPEPTENLKDSQLKKKRKVEDDEHEEEDFEIKNSSIKNSTKNPIKKIEQKVPSSLPKNSVAIKEKEKTKFHSEEPIILGGDDDIPQIFGCLETNDQPKKLITARLSGSNNEVHCLVEWNERKNGLKPAESFVSNKVLREKCPSLLLDFYESRLKFPNPNK